MYDELFFDTELPDIDLPSGIYRHLFGVDK